MKKGKIIGITGALGTGKTTVAAMFEKKGAVRIDADKIAHELLAEDGDTREQIIAVFGESILTGSAIDRRKLAEKVFLNKDKLGKLSDIMHPAIIKKIKDDAQSAGDKIVVIDAPLLMETGLDKFVDTVVVVTADKKTQLERVASRGMSREEAEIIIEKQMSLEEKVRLADFVIDNNGSTDKTKEGVEEVWQKI